MLTKLLTCGSFSCCWLGKRLGVRVPFIRPGVDGFVGSVVRGHDSDGEISLEWIREAA